MPDYFSEHDCEPLAAGQTPDHALHLARLLIDGGWSADWQLEFSQLFPGTPQAPAASKKAVDDLVKVLPDSSDKRNCTICLGELKSTSCRQMPCAHVFHDDCIMPWLQRTNSCPVCRHELPTDDAQYEQYKANKEAQKQREARVAELHHNMYS